MATATTRAEDTWVYAVEVSATANNPAGIVLTWRADPYNPSSYTLYRKGRDEGSWSPGTTLPGSATQFTDDSVAPGQAYEYKLTKLNVQVGYRGYGYIYAGNQAPLVENRGKVILIVASYLAAPLADELAQLQTDLLGDGWQVGRHDVDTAAPPSAVRELVVADYNADPSQVKAVFLLGRVPIFFSGNLNYDTHQYRAMPADAYYGDIDGYWSGSQNFLPSDVELMVGRVDLAGMRGVGSSLPWPNETELTRNYLNKDHKWRHKLMTANRRALMGNRRGDEDGEATAAGGYRTFSVSVGAQNVVEANTDDNAQPWDRWISQLSGGTYLWVYGCGGGQPTKISGLGTHGLYYDVWSTDMVNQDAKGVFVMLFGSWFGNWESTDNIMRSVLATPGAGLGSMISGRPHWFMHHMALGEPIGHSVRVSQNNGGLYQNHSNILARAIFPALMGDPTLRADQVAPPSGLTASVNGQTVTLEWGGSPDPIVGYHVYRGNGPAGPFTRRAETPIAATAFSETGVAQGNYTYMVKAIKLEAGYSGSYFNSSQGIFTAATVQNLPPEHPPITVRAQRSGNGVLLTWNSVAGVTYRVQAKTYLSDSTWWELPGSITAVGPETTWGQSNPGWTRFYRVVRLLP